MKAFALSLILVFAAQLHAVDLGKQIQFYADQDGAQFGAMFAYDRDQAWILNVSFWGPTLLPAGGMKSMAWRLYDSKTNTYLNDWTNAVNSQTTTYYPGTMAFSLNLEDAATIQRTIKALPQMKLLLSIDRPDLKTTHYVDLGAYCQSNPDKFVDLSKNRSGCPK